MRCWLVFLLAVTLSSGCSHSEREAQRSTPRPHRLFELVGLPDFYSVTANGQFVAFLGPAAESVDGRASRAQALVYDMTGRDTWMASTGLDGKPCNANVDSPTVSADGQSVAFMTRASNLVSGGEDRTAQIYLAERGTHRVTRISTSAERAADGPSFLPQITADGSHVVFLSKATNLVTPPLAAVQRHIFIWDRTSGQIRLITAADDGSPANAASTDVAVTPDGRRLAFTSWATNLTRPSTPKSIAQIYLSDLEHHSIVRVSEDATQPCFFPAISADGRWVAYEAWKSGTHETTILLCDMVEHKTTRISMEHYGDRATFRYPSLSSDGRFCAFVVPTNDSQCDVLVFDRLAGKTLRLAADASFNRRHLPRLLGDGSAVWLVASPTSVGLEDPNADESPTAAPAEEPEVIAIRNPFL